MRGQPTVVLDGPEAHGTRKPGRCTPRLPTSKGLIEIHGQSGSSSAALTTECQDGEQGCRTLRRAKGVDKDNELRR